MHRRLNRYHRRSNGLSIVSDTTTLCHHMSWNVFTYVMKSHDYHVMPMSWNVMSMSRNVMSMSLSVMWGHELSWNVMTCHEMSCHVMAWHVMSWHGMSCHVMAWHIMSYPNPNPNPNSLRQFQCSQKEGSTAPQKWRFVSRSIWHRYPRRLLSHSSTRFCATPCTTETIYVLGCEGTGSCCTYAYTKVVIYYYFAFYLSFAFSLSACFSLFLFLFLFLFLSLSLSTTLRVRRVRVKVRVQWFNF
jgi:hypothetical protein